MEKQRRKEVKNPGQVQRTYWLVHLSGRALHLIPTFALTGY